MQPVDGPSLGWARIVALALPLFALSSHSVTSTWPHPWLHLWILGTVLVALRTRRTLHAMRSPVGWNWHLYFLAAAAGAGFVGAWWLFSGRDAIDGLSAIGLMALGAVLCRSEMAHLGEAGGL